MLVKLVDAFTKNFWVVGVSYFVIFLFWCFTTSVATGHLHRSNTTKLLENRNAWSFSIWVTAIPFTLLIFGFGITFPYAKGDQVLKMVGFTLCICIVWVLLTRLGINFRGQNHLQKIEEKSNRVTEKEKQDAIRQSRNL